MTYYAFFAVFALCVLGFAVFGFVLDDPTIARAVGRYLAANLPRLDVQAMRDARGTAGVLALLVLPVIGLFWVDALRSAIRAMWRLPEYPGVHCDVKPSNLLVRGHDVRLIDFGIARYVGEWSPDDGTVQCSRGWAAPEQLHAGPATPAVDVFAWGCVLAYLAGGVHPFRSHSADEWVQRLRSAEPDLAGVPADLAEVIRATLARDPRNRPSARELTMICRTRGEVRLRTIPRRSRSA